MVQVSEAISLGGRSAELSVLPGRSRTKKSALFLSEAFDWGGWPPKERTSAYQDPTVTVGGAAPNVSIGCPLWSVSELPIKGGAEHTPKNLGRCRADRRRAAPIERNGARRSPSVPSAGSAPAPGDLECVIRALSIRGRPGLRRCCEGTDRTTTSTTAGGRRSHLPWAAVPGHAAGSIKMTTSDEPNADGDNQTGTAPPRGSSGPEDGSDGPSAPASVPTFSQEITAAGPSRDAGISRRSHGPGSASGGSSSVEKQVRNEMLPCFRLIGHPRHPRRLDGVVQGLAISRDPNTRGGDARRAVRLCGPAPIPATS